MSTPPPGPIRSHPPLGHQLDSDIMVSSGAVLNSDILACAGCGVVFKAQKLIDRNPSAKVIPRDLANVTCPLCLTTQGWENV
jgi:hypothetical protein